MNLIREEALKYHRQMWTDMQTELGDNPGGGERVVFKEDWCAKHFPNEEVCSSCFLCEYVAQDNAYGCRGGQKCPLVWPNGDCTTDEYYYTAPISEILALPEREV